MLSGSKILKLSFNSQLFHEQYLSFPDNNLENVWFGEQTGYKSTITLMICLGQFSNSKLEILKYF